MFNKNDPLIDSVKKVMAENEVRRQAEKDLNEELGIASKRALPFEHHKNYDALLEQKITEALKGDQHKIDANNNNKVDAQDFKILRAKKNVDEALKGNQAAIDANKNNKVDAQDFKILRAKKEMSEGIGDKEGTAGTVKKDGKDVVPDSEAKNPHMQASDDKPVPTPPERPKDLKESGKRVAGAILAKIRAKKMDEEIALSEEGNAEYQSDLPDMHKDLKANKKSTSQMRREYGSSWKRLLHHTNQNYDKATRENVIAMAKKHMSEVNEETLEENHVLYTHPKADIKVVRKGEGSKEGAHIEVHKSGKKIASGDYDRGADAFFMNVGGKGQKSFDTAKDIANHFHGLSEQFQQLDEKAPEGDKYERMVKHIKAGYSKDGKLTDKEKSIAYATAWKAKNKSKNMEEGLTAEQVMAEIRKNLGEAKWKKIEEESPDPEASKKEIDNPTPPGTPPNQTRPQPIQTTTQSGQMPTGSDSPPAKLPTFATGGSGTPSVKPVEPAKPAETPKVSSNADIADALGDTGPRSMGSAPSVSTTQKAATPAAPAPKPAAPSAPKPAAPKPAPTRGDGMTNAKDDIWDDSKIQRTGPGGEETAADFQRNSDLYKQRLAAGGQRPAPSAPAPARPAAPRPATPRPATPTPSRPYSPPLSMGAGRMAMREDVEQPTKLSFNDTITKILKG